MRPSHREERGWYTEGHREQVHWKALLLAVPSVMETEYHVQVVEWFDPHAVADTWTDVTQVIAEYKAHPMERVLTIGYLIHEDERNILIANNVTESQVSGVTVIPRVNVLEMRAAYSE